MQRIFALINFLFAYQQWIRTHRRGQWVRRIAWPQWTIAYLHRQDALPTLTVPPVYSPCKRLLTTLLLELMSVTFVLAVAAKMDAEDDDDAPTKNADIGCSATTINCSITHLM
ncbi:hypothetical protein TSMEX_002323 [Taenia solium]|eukprot:TsM_000332700 transcript=TsM_000332700 gene=TsM_000332700